MTPAEQDRWASLEAHAVRGGRARTRIRPEGSRDVFIEVDLTTRQRMITFARSWDGSPYIPSWNNTEALDCVARTQDSGKRLETSVLLRDESLNAVFDHVVDSLADVVVDAPTDDHAQRVLLERLAEWQTLFETLQRGGLGATERRGLVGELAVLRDLLLPTLDPDSAVASWTGPLRANQDFQADGLALEVKTTAALQPTAFTVNNERELDAGGARRLVLLHVVLDERLADGFTLPDLVAEVAALLEGSPGARSRFDHLLAQVGYADPQADLYGEPHYTLLETRYFEVVHGFPRIVTDELADGVGQVEYRVSLAACVPFETTAESVLSMIDTEVSGV